MSKVILHVAVFSAAAWVAGSGQAAAGCGTASAYGYTAQSVAHAEPRSQMEISAAHQSLPLGTRVIVRNQKTGRSIVVKIADRVHRCSPRVRLAWRRYGSGSRAYQRISMRDPFVRANKPEKRRSAKALNRTCSVHTRSGSSKRMPKLHQSVKRSHQRRSAGRG